MGLLFGNPIFILYLCIMITEEEYNQAKRVCDMYHEQKRKEQAERYKKMLEEFKEKEKYCEANGGHDYRPSGGRYHIVTEMTCSFCNKTIE